MRAMDEVKLPYDQIEATFRETMSILITSLNLMIAFH